jgi:alpha/beta superfamily hydrolase
MEKKVVFQNKYGEELAGVLHLPKGARKAPAAIIFHGLGGSKTNKRALAAELGKGGIISLRFDFSGSGGSEGDYQDASIQKHADVDAAVRLVKGLKQAGKIYLIGYSYGGMVCALYASKSREVSGVVTISSVFSYHDPGMLLKGLAGMKRWVRKGYIRKGGHVMLINNYMSIRKLRMAELVRQAKCPFLVIHGSKDELVSLGHAFGYHRNARSGRMHILEGASHFFPKKYELEAAKEIEEWISSTS